MKTKILTSILVGVLVTCFVSTELAIAANGNGAGLERVPVFIGFRQTPGPSEQALVRAHGGAIKYSYTLVPAIAASIPEPAIEGLRRNPNVTIIEPDIEVFAVDDELDNTWGVKRIGAGVVHDGLNKGAGVKVAIIDSGVYYTHPDLIANFDSDNLGYDFVNDDDDPMDDAGHGTHVAGTVAAMDNNVGVVGVAPEASLYAYKVLNASGSGNYSDIIAAMQQCEKDGIQVANLSLGSSSDPGETVKAAFDKAEEAGIVIVAAAGNSGNPPGIGDKVIYPARYESCIAVAATDQGDSRASWSSTGPDVEISAPGVGIYSTLLGGGYGYKSGTSMASPHVAGVVALMIKASVADVRSTLATTADDLGAAGRDNLYGFGLVDADEAAPPPVGNQPPTASFTGTPSGLSVVLDASASNDSDGTIVSYAWDFGDSSGGLGQMTSHTYTGAGTYTVILTVTDDDGAEGTASQEVTVEATVLPGIYVDKLSGGSSWLSRVWWDAYVDMDIRVGASADPVKGAIVHGMWSTGQSAISQPTDDDGCCQVTLSIHKKNATVTFTVTDIVHPEYEYTKPDEGPIITIWRP